MSDRPAKIDLHTHTTASDGAFPAAELVRRAVEAGIGTLAITDHDTVAGLPEAREAARMWGVRIIPGVEFGTTIDSTEVHMLGYLFDENHPELCAQLESLREGRLGRGRRMVEKLEEAGINVPWERVEAFAVGGSVGRPHVAQALIEAGYAASVDEAFDLYLAQGRPGFVERTGITPEECISLLHRAGGIAVLAHPSWLGDDFEPILKRLVAAGLDGMEAYYGSYEPALVDMLVGIARQHNLVPTGGSDFHGLGGLSHANLGTKSVPPECIVEMERRAGR